MMTSNHPSDLVYRAAYPNFVQPELRIDLRSAALPADSEEQLGFRSNPEGKELGDIFYLMESRPLNPWAVIGSLVVVSVLLLALIAIPLFLTDPLPKREMLTMLYLQPRLAAGAQPKKFQAPPKLRPTYTAASIAISAPVHITAEAAPPPIDITGEVAGGVPGGVVGGSPGGVLSEMVGGPRSITFPAKTPEPMPVKRIRIASRVAEANLIYDVPPQYPPEAGRERIEGTVVLLVVIGTDGCVQDVQVVSGGLPILVQAAMEAVKQWRYKPYLLNGEPVEIASQITVNFTLSRG